MPTPTLCCVPDAACCKCVCHVAWFCRPTGTMRLAAHIWPALQDPASFPQAQQVAWADLRALAPSPLLLVDSQEPTDILVALAAGPLCSASPVEASARCPLAACCLAHKQHTHDAHTIHTRLLFWAHACMYASVKHFVNGLGCASLKVTRPPSKHLMARLLSPHSSPKPLRPVCSALGSREGQLVLEAFSWRGPVPGRAWQRLRSGGTTAGRLELPRGRHLLRLLAPADRLQAVELRSRTAFQVAEAGKVSSRPKSWASTTCPKAHCKGGVGSAQVESSCLARSGRRQMALHVAEAGLPAHMLTGGGTLPCSLPCKPVSAACCLCSSSGVHSRCCAGGMGSPILECKTPDAACSCCRCWSRRRACPCRRRRGACLSSRQGPGACASGQPLGQADAPRRACPVHAISGRQELCMVQSGTPAQPWSSAVQLTEVASWFRPLVPPLLALTASLGWPTGNAKVGLRLCYNVGVGTCSLWLRPHMSAGT